MKFPWGSALIVMSLIAMRFIAGAVLPLSFDETYYWLWSRHLAASYFDHPPAIAYAIAAGTTLFGSSEFAIRIVGLLASIASSFAVWRAGAIMTRDERAGAIACLYFNLTLMTTVESIAATPDAMLLPAASFLLLALAKLEDSADGRWWLAAGAALGFGFLSKYTAFFLAIGTAVWLLTPRGRKWLMTPWPYLAFAITVIMFAPVIAWNAAHDWVSFRFQFGRVTEGHFTFVYLGEFLLGQVLLASPFILILGVAGTIRTMRREGRATVLTILATLILPATLYFSIHSLHDRVQGNWPSFLYPALAIAAAYAAAREPQGNLKLPLQWSRRLAVPAAVTVLIVCYTQAFFGIWAGGLFDPTARLLSFGFPELDAQLHEIYAAKGAHGILTSNYTTTGQIDYYIRPSVPVIQINDDFRWLSAPRATTEMLNAPMIYVSEHGHFEGALLAAHFSHVQFLTNLKRLRSGSLVDTFDVYLVSGFHGEPIGRIP